MSPACLRSLQCPFCLRHLLWTVLSIGWTLGGVSQALRITSTGTQTLYVAENQDIVISCTYEVDAADVGSLDIEWSIVSPDTTQRDQVILTFLHDQQFEYPNPLSGRFGFTEADPSQGDASVRVRNLQASDTNSFQCKVKKAPGIDSRKVTVGVHIRPENPECWTERSGEEDGDVVLHCVSHSGTPPLTYSWKRIDEGLLPQSTLDTGSGTLLIRDTTPESDGTYLCSVSNLVGHSECGLVLTSTAGHSKAGMIVGIVLGILLALLLLLLLLWLLYWCCRRNHQKKDRPNDIREDVVAPGSRASSIRSVRSYRSHHTRKDYSPGKTMDLLLSPSAAALYSPVPGVSPTVSKTTFVV